VQPPGRDRRPQWRFTAPGAGLLPDANGDDTPYTKTYWTLNNNANGQYVRQVKGGNLGSYIGANMVGANIK
jgi:hypothetical protein